MEKWGFKRFGQTKLLDVGGIEYQNFLQEFSYHAKKEYAGMTKTKDWIELFETLASSREEYNDPEIQLLFKIVAVLREVNVNKLDKKNNTKNQMNHLNNVLNDYAINDGNIANVVILKAIFHQFLLNPIGFTTDMLVALLVTSSVALLSSTNSFMIQQELQDIMDTIDDIDEYTEKYSSDHSTIRKNDGTFAINKYQGDIKRIEVITNTKIYKRSDLSSVKQSINNAKNNCSGFFKLADKIIALFFASKTDPNNPNADMLKTLEHGHTPLTYILWINSMYYGTNGWIAVHGKDGTKGSRVAPVSIPSNITTLGYNCFAGNKAIETIKISEGVKYIRTGCFTNCENLKEVIIPNSVIGIGSNAFLCNNLLSITLPCDLPTDGCFTYGNRTNEEGRNELNCNIRTIRYTFRNEGKMLDETDSVAKHGTDRTLTSIILDEGITHIGKECFHGRYALTSVNLPSTLKTIGESAFHSCTALKHIELPSSLQSLGTSSFSGCSALQSITIPEKVTVIPASCFSVCTGLTSLVIPNTVTELGKDAFNGCTNITTITLPCDLHTSNCFGGSKVEMIHFTYGQTGKIIDKESWSLMSDAQHTISSIILDDGITHIGKSCFYGLRNLTSVKLPSNIKEIGLRAFQQCDNLEYISIPNSISFVDIGAFHNCNKLNTVVYNGTEEDWGKITIKEENEPLMTKTGQKAEGVTVTGKHCVHNYEAVVTTPATCTTDGIITYTCTKCNDSFSDIVRSTGHSYVSTTTKPNCVTMGFTTHKCKECNDAYTDSFTFSFEHSWNNDVNKGWDIKSYDIETGSSELERKCKHCNRLEIKIEREAVQRLAGSNRYATAAAISKKSFKTSDTVVLAYGSNSADALAGVTLAAHYNAPILLTDTKKLPADTLNEIKRLKTKKVIILGGEGAIGTDVESVLNKNNITTQRIAGKTRFGTATAIAEELTNNPKEIFFVYAYNFADALSASTVAAVKGAPTIYLKTTGDIDADTAAYLAKVKGKVTKAYVIGGKGVISDNMKNKAGKALGLSSVTRVAGADRYATCVAVNEKFKDVLTGDGICVAKGLDFPDALAGGVFAALNKMPLFLADGNLKEIQSSYLGNKDISNVYIFGGTGAVPDNLIKKIAEAS